MLTVHNAVLCLAAPPETLVALVRQLTLEALVSSETSPGAELSLLGMKLPLRPRPRLRPLDPPRQPPLPLPLQRQAHLLQGSETTCASMV